MSQGLFNQSGVKPAAANSIEFNVKVEGDWNPVLGSLNHFFGKAVFSGGKQEKVILSVCAGQYDIGTIREGSLDVVADKIDINKIRIIAMTDPYPGWVYAARKELDKKTVTKLREALEKLDFNNRNHHEILEAAHFIKVIASSDSDFDSVRRLTARLGISLEE